MAFYVHGVRCQNYSTHNTCTYVLRNTRTVATRRQQDKRVRGFSTLSNASHTSFGHTHLHSEFDIFVSTTMRLLFAKNNAVLPLNIMLALLCYFFSLVTTNSGVQAFSFSFRTAAVTQTKCTANTSCSLRASVDGDSPANTILPLSFSRRSFLISSGFVGTFPIVASAEESSRPPKVLVLGGTGLVGSEIVRQLRAKNVDVIATSRDGRQGTQKLDVTTPGIDVAKEVEKLSQGCQSVISTIGAIPYTTSLTDTEAANIQSINAASGLAAVGAKAAGVKHFVFISNAPEVKALMTENPALLNFLQPYAKGKALSEAFIQMSFGQGKGLSYTLVKPTFIFGGEKFGLTPPRVNKSYGELIETILSLGPFRAAANILPGIIGIAFEPPVSAEAVAGAAIAGAFSDESLVFDTHDKITNAAN